MQITPKQESELKRFSNLPPGEYPFTVLESAVKVSQSAKNRGREMVAIKLNVHGPEFDRHVYDYFADWFSEWKLKHFCETAGLGADYRRGEIEPGGNAWAGRTGFVKIAIEEDQKYGEKNVVEDYLPNESQKVETSEKATTQIIKSETQQAPAPEGDDVPF